MKSTHQSITHVIYLSEVPEHLTRVNYDYYLRIVLRNLDRIIGEESRAY